MYGGLGITAAMALMARSWHVIHFRDECKKVSELFLFNKRLFTQRYKITSPRDPL